MRVASGPRPWSINAFALVALAFAFFNLSWSLWFLDDPRILRISPLTGEAATRDEQIVMSSANFTIHCIPVIAIWLFGSRVARWIVTAFVAVGTVIWATGLGPSYFALAQELHPAVVNGLVGRVLLIAGVVLIFLPGASRWFSKTAETRRADLAVSE